MKKSASERLDKWKKDNVESKRISVANIIQLINIATELQKEVDEIPELLTVAHFIGADNARENLKRMKNENPN